MVGFSRVSGVSRVRIVRIRVRFSGANVQHVCRPGLPHRSSMPIVWHSSVDFFGSTVLGW